MEYVLMSESHIDDVADLEKLCFSDPWSESSIASELRNPLSTWFVALDNDRVVGYVGSQSVLDGADMMNIAVSPEYRRMGIAQALVERLEAALKVKGVICLALEVRASNTPAIALYEKLGFYVAGRRPNYYRHPKEDALIMRQEWTN